MPEKFGGSGYAKKAVETLVKHMRGLCPVDAIPLSNWSSFMGVPFRAD